MPTNLDLQRKIAILEQQLGVLQLENEMLTERAEDIVLLGAVSEKIKQEHNDEAVLDITLEAVCNLKGFEAGFYVELLKDSLNILQFYDPEGTSVPQKDQIAFSPSMVKRLLAGETFFDATLLEGCGDLFVDLKKKGGVLFVPFKHYAPARGLLFFSRSFSSVYLKSLAPLLQRIGDLVEAHLDNIELFEDVQELNRGLEQMVAQRTTELLEANQHLQEEAVRLEKAQADLELFRKLLDQSNDAIFIIDPATGQFLDVNQRACERLGYEPAELLDMRVIDIDECIPDQQSWEQYRDFELRQGSLVLRDGRHKRKDGSAFPVEVALNLISHDGGQYLVAVARDISERVEMERRIRQAQKMEAIGTLAGGIAHDFNNILTPIVGYAEMILHQAGPGGKLQTQVREILQASLRAKDLVQQILVFSRQTEHELKPIRIDLVVKETMKLMRASIPRSISIHEDIAQLENLVLADPVHIHQVVMNLCTNAYQAMQETGGTLSVFLEPVDFAQLEDRIRAHLRENHQYLHLRVSDTGHGIPAEIRDKIFEPYFTTKGLGEGTGLGLAVVHGIVKALDGYLALESEPGRETCFDIFLPVYVANGNGCEPGAVENLNPYGTESILLVDDEVDVLGLERDILESFGYQVTAVQSANEALKIFSRSPAKFDLVITDVTMPTMNGDELAREIRVRSSRTPVILCTGYSDRINAINDSAVIASGYLLKPVTISKLTKLVREVLAKAAEESSG